MQKNTMVEQNQNGLLKNKLIFMKYYSNPEQIIKYMLHF